MKKIFVIVALLATVAVFTASANAIWFVKGTELDNWNVDFKLFLAGDSNYNSENFYRFMDYIEGVIDANYDLGDSTGAKYFSIPVGTTVKSVCAVVSRYLDNNQDKLNKTGAYLVVSALELAYPK
jgi:hypothetical protein